MPRRLDVRARSVEAMPEHKRVGVKVRIRAPTFRCSPTPVQSREERIMGFMQDPALEQGFLKILPRAT